MLEAWPLLCQPRRHSCGDAFYAAIAVPTVDFPTCSRPTLKFPLTFAHLGRRGATGWYAACGKNYQPQRVKRAIEHFHNSCRLTRRSLRVFPSRPMGRSCTMSATSLGRAATRFARNFSMPRTLALAFLGCCLALRFLEESSGQNPAAAKIDKL